MKRLQLPVLLVLAALFRVVDIASRALQPLLRRSEARASGSSLVERLRALGFALPIAGGATLTEANRTGAHLLSESPGAISRDTVTILSGQDLAAGAVLGKVTASGKYRAVQPGGGDGSETAVAVLYAATDASAADVAGAVIHNFACEVISSALAWPAGITAGQKTTALAELKTLYIKAR